MQFQQILFHCYFPTMWNYSGGEQRLPGNMCWNTAPLLQDCNNNNRGANQEMAPHQGWWMENYQQVPMISPTFDYSKSLL